MPEITHDDDHVAAVNPLLGLRRAGRGAGVRTRTHSEEERQLVASHHVISALVGEILRLCGTSLEEIARRRDECPVPTPVGEEGGRE